MSKPPNWGRPWTEEDLHRLRRMMNAGATAKSAAERLGRSEKSVHSAVCTLGIERDPPSHTPMTSMRLTLSRDTYGRLAREAARRGIRTTALVRTLLAEHLPE